MSRETNEGVMMRFKTITANLSTIVHLLVEPIKSLEKPKASLEASFSIRQLSWTVTSNKSIVSPPCLDSSVSTICLDPIDIVEALLRVMSEIVLTAAEGEIQLEKWSARQVETVSTSCTSSRGGMLFAGVPISGENDCWRNIEQVVLRTIWYWSICHSGIS